MGRRLLRRTTVPGGINPAYVTRKLLQADCSLFVQGMLGPTGPSARLAGVMVGQLCGYGYDALAQVGLVPSAQPARLPDRQRSTYFRAGQPGRPPDIQTVREPEPQVPFQPIEQRPTPSIPQVPSLPVSQVPPRLQIPSAPTAVTHVPSIAQFVTPGEVPFRPQPQVVQPAGQPRPSIFGQGALPQSPQAPIEPIAQGSPPRSQVPSAPVPGQPGGIDRGQPPTGIPVVGQATRLPDDQQFVTPRNEVPRETNPTGNFPALADSSVVPAGPLFSAFLPNIGRGRVNEGSSADAGFLSDKPVILVPGPEGVLPIPNPFYFIADIANLLGLGTTRIAAQKESIQNFYTPLFRAYSNAISLTLRDNHALQFSSQGVRRELSDRPDLQALVPVLRAESPLLAGLFSGDTTGLSERLVNQFLANVAINGWSAQHALNFWQAILSKVPAQPVIPALPPEQQAVSTLSVGAI